MNRTKILSLLPVLALAACASLHSQPAEAATVVVSWDNPTTNTDGSAIPDTGSGQLQSWRIQYGTCVSGAFGTPGGPDIVRTRTSGGPALVSGTFNVQPGNTCFRVYVTNNFGIESDASNVFAYVVPPPKPNPATNGAASSGS